jgi:putative ABC transport system ATP-binding protein
MLHVQRLLKIIQEANPSTAAGKRRIELIKLENIQMIFNQNTADENIALKNVNLKINKGDFITVIGSNGAGKSTLYNVIAGTLQPTGGKILLDINQTGNTGGQTENIRDITHDKEYKRALYIGRIFQNPLLGTAGKLSLEDNMMICSKKGWKGLKISLNRQRREYFREQLKILNMGLEDRLNDNVNQFSGGQRQALTLLMAVMSRPSLLLLDEHTAALDPANADIIMKLTRKFAKEYNLTVMMVTHNMQQALDYGSRLLMMDGGEIILDINSEDKARLTMEDIIKRFHEIKNRDLANDQMLLQ